MGAFIGLLFASGVLLIAVAGRGQSGSLPTTTPANRRRISVSTVQAVGFAVFVGVLVFVITGLVIVGLFAAIASGRIPSMLRARKQTKLMAQRRASWPDVIDSLVSAVRAGLSLPEAVCAIAERGPECVRADFARFASDYRASGRFEMCALRLRNELKDPVADRIFEALLAAREVGGSDLGNMLRSLAEFVRQDLRLRGEVEARRSWTVNGARLAVAAPWLVLLMLCSRPGTVDSYANAGGAVVLAIAAVISVGAYRLMMFIGRLPDEQRIVA